MKWESKRGRCGFPHPPYSHHSTCNTGNTDSVRRMGHLQTVQTLFDKENVIMKRFILIISIYNEQNMVHDVKSKRQCFDKSAIGRWLSLWWIMIFCACLKLPVCSLQSSTWPVSAERWDLGPTPGWRSYVWMETRCPTNSCRPTGSSACECLKVFTSDPPSEHATN